MKLQEEHKVFVVKHFARFMKLTDIVDAFMEKFEEDLPPPEIVKAPSVEELLAEPLDEYGLEDKREFIEKFMEEHTEEFQKEYGDEADQKLNEKALEEYESDRVKELISLHDGFLQEEKEDLQKHFKNLQQNLFNRFRRLDINHPQFPQKYRTLFQETRDEYCTNYRIQALSNPQNLAKELETLYGYQKQLIFQGNDPKELSKHLNSAHQILKTVLTHNALNARQQVPDITPQNPKALKGSQKALPKPPKEDS